MQQYVHCKAYYMYFSGIEIRYEYSQLIIRIINCISSTYQTIQDWMLALIVMMFVAIDVIILVVYLIYNGAEGSLTATQFSNAENLRDERGVSAIPCWHSHIIIPVVNFYWPDV